MPSDTALSVHESRLVCAILAAQVTALRERIAGPFLFEQMLGCADLLSALSAKLAPGSEAAAAAARLDSALDDLALQHAQHQDLARQTAELVALALKILSTEDPGKPPALSPAGLAALYVSEDQRRLHEAVLAEYEPR